MAVILQMTYQKKLGLPNYSSHSCSVSLTVEIPDASVAAQESTKLYALLQTAVDNEIQRVGFMPDATTYGMNNGNGATRNGTHTKGQDASNGNGNGHTTPARANDPWNCTDGQRGLILRLVSGGGRAHDKRASSQRQVLVSNVDTALLVIGLNHDFSLRRVERYQALLQLAGVPG